MSPYDSNVQPTWRLAALAHRPSLLTLEITVSTQASTRREVSLGDHVGPPVWWKPTSGLLRLSCGKATGVSGVVRLGWRSSCYSFQHPICVFPQDGPNTLLKEKPNVMNLIDSFHFGHHHLSLTYLWVSRSGNTKHLSVDSVGMDRTVVKSLDDKGHYERGHR